MIVLYFSVCAQNITVQCVLFNVVVLYFSVRAQNITVQCVLFNVVVLYFSVRAQNITVQCVLFSVVKPGMRAVIKLTMNILHLVLRRSLLHSVW